VRVERHYSYYSKVRQNFYTYKVEIEDIDNSNTSNYYNPITFSIVMYCSVMLYYYVSVLVR
jgi:hypothetical protein